MDYKFSRENRVPVSNAMKYKDRKMGTSEGETERIIKSKTRIS